MTMVASHMGVERPMHPAAEVALFERPKDEVEMVGHQALRQEAHRDFDLGMGESFHEGVVVAVLKENALAIVASIENVVALVANRGSGGTGHS